MEMFAIRDNQTESFDQPFFSPAIGSAKRAFMDAVSKKDSSFYNHPDDYTLFHLGTFNQFTGEIVPLTTPTSLGLASTYIQEGM